MAQKRTRYITIRTTPALYNEMRRRAKQEKRTLSGYAELLLIAATVATDTGLPPAKEIKQEVGA